MKILIAGSSNVDLFAHVDHLPTAGETVGNAGFMQAAGGKGANQAVAAARLGGEVTFVTSLGNDLYGAQTTLNLEKEGICARVIVDESKPTGTALIYVAANGENCIAVAPGANHSLKPASVEEFADLVADCSIIVLQAEIPYETNKAFAREAKRRGKKVLFNPAPACAIDREMMQLVDYLIVNEVEASHISGVAFNGTNHHDVAQALIKAGAGAVVMTLGGNGVFVHNGTRAMSVPAYKVKAVDTVGAGDTFCGALAVKCAGGELDENAVAFANAAAALAVTRPGAQPSIPKLQEVLEFMKN